MKKLRWGYSLICLAIKLSKKLQESIHQYETDDSWQLYLLKKDDDFIGLIGMELGEEDYTLQHLSVNPSFRGEGIGQGNGDETASALP